MKDLASARWMYAKTALFVVVGLTCAALLIVQSPTIRTAALLAIAIWSFCRAYYFAFYVIESYLDTTYKYSGLISLLKYLVLEKRFKKETTLARIDK